MKRELRKESKEYSVGNEIYKKELYKRNNYYSTSTNCIYQRKKVYRTEGQLL